MSFRRRPLKRSSGPHSPPRVADAAAEVALLVAAAVHPEPLHQVVSRLRRLRHRQPLRQALAPVRKVARAPAVRRGGGRGGGGRGNQPPPTPEEQAAQAAAQAAAWKRRLGVPMDRYKALRKLYNDAGVSIYGFKMSLNTTMTDEQYDYVFNAAEALGATHVTMELPTDPVLLKRIGEFALKRRSTRRTTRTARGTSTRSIRRSSCQRETCRTSTLATTTVRRAKARSASWRSGMPGR